MVRGLRSPLTGHIQESLETKSLLDGEFCTSSKFPMGVTSINTLYSSSQSENSPWRINPLLYFLGAIFISSWPLLLSA